MPAFCDLSAISFQLENINSEIQDRSYAYLSQPIYNEQLFPSACDSTPGVTHLFQTLDSDPYRNSLYHAEDPQLTTSYFTKIQPHFPMLPSSTPFHPPSSSPDQAVVCSESAGKIQLVSPYRYAFQDLPNAFQPSAHNSWNSSTGPSSLLQSSPQPYPNRPEALDIASPPSHTMSTCQLQPAVPPAATQKSKILSTDPPLGAYIPRLPQLTADRDAWRVVVDHWLNGIPEHGVRSLCSWEPAWIKSKPLYRQREIIALEFLVR